MGMTKAPLKWIRLFSRSGRAENRLENDITELKFILEELLGDLADYVHARPHKFPEYTHDPYFSERTYINYMTTPGELHRMLVSAHGALGKLPENEKDLQKEELAALQDIPNAIEFCRLILQREWNRDSLDETGQKLMNRAAMAEIKLSQISGYREYDVLQSTNDQLLEHRHPSAKKIQPEGIPRKGWLSSRVLIARTGQLTSRLPHDMKHTEVVLYQAASKEEADNIRGNLRAAGVDLQPFHKDYPYLISADLHSFMEKTGIEPLSYEASRAGVEAIRKAGKDKDYSR